MRRRAGTALSGKAVRDSWGSVEDSQGSFLDEAGQVEHEGESIAEEGGLVWQDLCAVLASSELIRYALEGLMGGIGFRKSFKPNLTL